MAIYWFRSRNRAAKGPKMTPAHPSLEEVYMPPRAKLLSHWAEDLSDAPCAPPALPAVQTTQGTGYAAASGPRPTAVFRRGQLTGAAAVPCWCGSWRSGDRDSLASFWRCRPQQQRGVLYVDLVCSVFLTLDIAMLQSFQVSPAGGQVSSPECVPGLFMAGSPGHPARLCPRSGLYPPFPCR